MASAEAAASMNLDMSFSFEFLTELQLAPAEENDSDTRLHPASLRKFHLAPTILGSIRQAPQTIPRPTRPLPGRASVTSAPGEPAASSRAAASGAAKLVPRTRV